MVEYGVVSRVNGGKATVCFDRRGECDRCHICDTSRDGMKCELILPDTLGVMVGDYVKIEVYRKSVRMLSAAMYSLVLLLTGIGVLIGTFMSLGATVTLGLGGFVVGLGVAIGIDFGVIRKKRGFKPVMLEISTEAEYLKNKVK